MTHREHGAPDCGDETHPHRRWSAVHIPNGSNWLGPATQAPLPRLQSPGGSELVWLSPLDRRASSFVKTSRTFSKVSPVSGPFCCRAADGLGSSISLQCHSIPSRAPTIPTASCTLNALNSTVSTAPLSPRLFGSRTTITNWAARTSFNSSVLERLFQPSKMPFNSRLTLTPPSSRRLCNSPSVRGVDRIRPCVIGRVAMTTTAH